jgi:hypothetical protein
MDRSAGRDRGRAGRAVVTTLRDVEIGDLEAALGHEIIETCVLRSSKARG